ncbi:MAG: crotonase/enoyl-CoA hydratase family protein [Gammaproteobacteria bacterium]|jgi:enoyl-CoA hydratase|nr:crotonase/enoyl-CoA hydratase family protein [Gammaproteobacteria bacterium]MBT5202837.1 crotonase/enoyl-CoA hydratase family protein [Gammaproteobacteria bacterium]MBT5603508.1 crotonase/enoyl-CoA hydratase family protein [Gammaproteobacteria bacterium]MBT6244177.1 crotonase/enoyl-CoA hydratase family protein [Gammaproteobacteria bacterium]
MYECFEVSMNNKIAHVQLNRPEKRNSMNPQFWKELPEIIKQIDQQAEARVIVISSTGPHFSSGLDVSSFAGVGQSASETDEKTRRIQAGSAFYSNVLHMQESFNCIEQARVPVLAAIQGGCIGGGVDLVTSCDIRYATADAFLTIFETNIGMTADVGTFPRLVKLIPEGYVKELAYTGRRVAATEAKQMGLINEVYDGQESLLKAVMEIAAEIASKAPLAVYGCKKMINYARDHSTADGLDYIALWNASHLKVEEIQEAMLANAEKRPGDFVGIPKTNKNN